MPVDSGILEYVREQMSLVEPIVIKRMFGGAGFYARGYFFALIDDDTVYFKTDDSNRGEYLAVNSPPFAPFGEDQGSMDYHELPDLVLDNPTKLKLWMQKSIEVAIRAKQRKSGSHSAKQKSNTVRRKASDKVALEKPGKLKKINRKTAAKKSPAPKKKNAKRKTR
jgi:DNA transformation protein and related proteins